MISSKKFEKTERDYKQVKSRRDELIQENEELERKIDLLEDKKWFMLIF